MHRKLIALACCGAMFTAAAGPASAQQPFGCYGGGGYGYWGSHRLDGGVTLPYFSLYPPVYYSYPVPRSYGYSPFAYPPCTMTPEVSVQALPSKVMLNPHVSPSKHEATSDRTAGGPLTIVNPFVDAALLSDTTEIASARR